MLELKIIPGSTRDGRMADLIGDRTTRRAETHGEFNAEILDLREWNLPFFAETMHTVGDPTKPTYSDPSVKRWNETIAQGDAFIFITPEYNHSYSGVLKNAIDSVFTSWAVRNKPAAFVGYGAGIVGGTRAVEHLAHVVIEAEMVPIRSSVILPQIHTAFAPDGEPANPGAELAMSVTLDDLAWWANLLRKGRADGELVPAVLRLVRPTNGS